MGKYIRGLITIVQGHCLNGLNIDGGILHRNNIMRSLKAGAMISGFERPADNRH